MESVRSPLLGSVLVGAGMKKIIVGSFIRF